MNKCYVCDIYLNQNNILLLPMQNNNISSRNISYFNNIHHINLINDRIIIKKSSNFIFMYYVFCKDCINQYLSIYTNIFKLLLKREINNNIFKLKLK